MATWVSPQLGMHRPMLLFGLELDDIARPDFFRRHRPIAAPYRSWNYDSVWPEGMYMPRRTCAGLEGTVLPSVLFQRTATCIF